MYFTEDDSETERILTETLTAPVQQTLEHLCEWHLVGARQVCAKKLTAYRFYFACHTGATQFSESET
jgi:hypothetical protein